MNTLWRKKMAVAKCGLSEGRTDTDGNRDWYGESVTRSLGTSSTDLYER